ANPALRGGATASRRPRSTARLRDLDAALGPSRARALRGGMGRNGAGTGYRKASYSRCMLTLEVRTNPRQSLRLKTDVNTECQSPERKGASFAQSGEQWPLKPRRCRKRGAGSQFLQVRRTQQAVQLHPPCIFLHIARA
ncbi:hypothetical protein LEMLEM_LOCUS11991, partial [Lemmus lemmus]